MRALFLITIMLAVVIGYPMLRCPEPQRPACLDLPGQAGQDCIERLLRKDQR